MAGYGKPKPKPTQKPNDAKGGGKKGSSRKK